MNLGGRAKPRAEHVAKRFRSLPENLVLAHRAPRMRGRSRPSPIIAFTFPRLTSANPIQAKALALLDIKLGT